MIPLNLQRLSPRDTEERSVSSDFVGEVKQLAEELLHHAGSREGMWPLLARKERLSVVGLTMELPVLHRAVVLKDVVLLAAVIRLLGVAALRVKGGSSQIEVWELAGCLGEETVALLCQRALARAGELEEITNPGGETFELLLRTSAPALADTLFGGYWTSFGPAQNPVCRAHTEEGWAGGPWTRSEVPTLAPRQWLCLRGELTASSRLRGTASHPRVSQAMGCRLRALIEGCRSLQGWHTRALVVGRPADQDPSLPDLGDGLFAGCRIPAGQLLGVAAGRFSEGRPDPEEFAYFWQTQQGSIAPRRLGGIMARAQTSFPNIVDLCAPLPCGLVSEAFLAAENIEQGQILAVDYGYHHFAKLHSYVELRPQALTAFIEQLSTMDLKALVREIRRQAGLTLDELCSAPDGSVSSDALVGAQALARHAFQSQLMYVLGTPSALVEFFWKSPALAVKLEALVFEELEQVPMLSEVRTCILGGPDGELQKWACSMTPKQRAVLSNYFSGIPTRYSGATLINILSWLGASAHLPAGLRLGLTAYAKCKANRSVQAQSPMFQECFAVIEEELSRLEGLRQEQLQARHASGSRS